MNQVSADASKQKLLEWPLNSWYQAAWSHELQKEAMFSRTLLDHDVLLFRDSKGVPYAVEDRCPHRFAPLSAGKLTDGVVRCGYHGLAFNGEGKCVANPHGAITSAMRVKSYKSVERHEAIWIWAGTEPANPDLIPNLTFIDETPASAKFFGYMDTGANYQLLSDNILDLSHADFLHPQSLGGIMSAAKATTTDNDSELIVQWVSKDCEPPPAYLSLVPPPSRADIWTEVRWRAPAVMVLGTGADPTGSPRDPTRQATTLHNMTPASKSRTHYFFCSTRKFNVDDSAFNEMLSGLISGAFRDEDKPMLEKQQRVIGDAEFWSLSPVLLGIDTGAVKARRRLEKIIAAERSQMATLAGVAS